VSTVIERSLPMTGNVDAITFTPEPQP